MTVFEIIKTLLFMIFIHEPETEVKFSHHTVSIRWAYRRQTEPATSLRLRFTSVYDIRFDTTTKVVIAVSDVDYCIHCGL